MPKNDIHQGLFLDLGTQCGWAVLRKSGRQRASGTLDLRTKRHESASMRYVRFRSSLDGIVDSFPLDIVAYEEVAAHRGTAAAQIYGGLVATLQMWCEDNDLPFLGVPVATIKRRATGKGNAGKPAMIDAARKQWPDIAIIDDNHADALWIGVAAFEEVN